jgi:hypothetical protein
MMRMNIYKWGLMGLLLMASACQPSQPPTPTAVDSAVLAQAMTPIPTLAIAATVTS